MQSVCHLYREQRTGEYLRELYATLIHSVVTYIEPRRLKSHGTRLLELQIVA